MYLVVGEKRKSRISLLQSDPLHWLACKKGRLCPLVSGLSRRKCRRVSELLLFGCVGIIYSCHCASHELRISNFENQMINYHWSLTPDKLDSLKQARGVQSVAIIYWPVVQFDEHHMHRQIPKVWGNLKRFQSRFNWSLIEECFRTTFLFFSSMLVCIDLDLPENFEKCLVSKWPLKHATPARNRRGRAQKMKRRCRCGFQASKCMPLTTSNLQAESSSELCEVNVATSGFGFEQPVSCQWLSVTDLPESRCSGVCVSFSCSLNSFLNQTRWIAVLCEAWAWAFICQGKTMQATRQNRSWLLS